MYRLGIDVGGTFTDFLFVDMSSGRQLIEKTSTTSHDPSIGVMNGLMDIAHSLSLDVVDLLKNTELIVHGTTVTTNAVLTNTGAKTGLVTTAGFRDILQMRRGVRSREHLFDNRYVAPPALVDRYLRIGVQERTDVNGVIQIKVTEEALQEAVHRFKEENVESVAICFMHSYANPENELKAKEILSRELPHVFITTSVEISPMVRLYNRVSTTAMNAYVGPILKSYIDQLLKKLLAAQFSGELLIMQSNGGVTSPREVVKMPVTTVLSGPSAGPVAGSVYAQTCDYKNGIFIDMGGTSFEASIVSDGEVTIKKEGELNRNLISLPMTDIHSIGAGGGSIAWIDQGGLLKVGPQSAGSNPGPVCYGRGGTQPTCSDADLVLGYLNPNYFLGGEMTLNIEDAKRAIQKQIAEPLNMSVEEAAFGIFQILNLNMANGIKEITVKNGYDPREFPMIVAGGAGSVHAAMIAQELGIRTVIIPRSSSVLCAVGMLASPLRHDYVRSFHAQWIDVSIDAIKERLAEDRRTGIEALTVEGVPEDKQQVIIGLDLRYAGQHYEVTIEFEEEELSSKEQVEEAFHQEHERLYGFHLKGSDVEIVNVRLSCRGKVASFHPQKVATAQQNDEKVEKRTIFDPVRKEFVEASIYKGNRLAAGFVAEGPAIVEEVTTSILIPSGFEIILTPHDTFIVMVKD